MQHLLSILLGLSLAGCLSASKRASVKDFGDSLKITGHVVSPGGLPLSGANLFVDQLDESVAVSSADGSFEIDLDRASLIRIAGKTISPQNNFFVYAEQDAGVPLLGVSSAIDLKERGGAFVGDIIVASPVTVSGMAYVVPQGRRLEPAAGASVSIGRERAVVAADGQFKLSGVPAGELPLHIAAQQFAPYYATIAGLAGEEKALNKPVFLFPELGIAGALIALPMPENAELVAAGHPFLRSFVPLGSRDAKYVRYHHDSEVLTSRGDQAWLKIPDRFDYDFPGNGGHTLYYQFADENRRQLSDVYRQGVILDLFSDSKGIVIGDGSGVTMTRNVLVKVDVPAAAYKMRLADSLEGLSVRPWQQSKALVEFIFPLNIISSSAIIPLGVQREIFCQFADAMGNESVAFKATVRLDLFPSRGLIIGDGSGLSTSRRVTVHIDVPPAAISMRLSEDIGELVRTASWLEPAATIDFLFGVVVESSTGFYSASGARQIFAQFVDASGFVSPIISASTTIQVFPPAAVVFQIEGGAPTAMTRTVGLSINVPPNAFEMRIFEANIGTVQNILNNALVIDPTTDTRNLWIQANSTTLYTFAVRGPKMLYVQFRDVDGIVGTVHKQAITIAESTSDGSPGFVVNGGATFSDTPHLLLTLLPPVNAIAYRVFEGSSPNTNLPWVRLQSVVPYSSATTGPAIIRLQYLTVDYITALTYEQPIDIEPLPVDWGNFSVNGGAFATTSPNLQLAIAAPPSASYMAVSQGLTPVDMLVWVPVSNAYTMPVSGSGLKTIYLRFKTVDNIVSDYALPRSIFFQPFPMDAAAVAIDGGAATTASTAVNLAITVPPNATGMRVNHDLEVLNDLPFTVTAATMSYVIPNVAGPIKIYVQFRDAQGEQSDAFFDAITKL